MAENEKPDDAVETPVVPPVVENKQEQVEEKEYTETEHRALDQGWEDKDAWVASGRNPEDHRSAKEYIDRGELLGKIKSQATEMREVKAMLVDLSNHNKKVYVAGYEKALAELKVQRVAAMKDGEVEALVAIEDKIDQTKEAMAVVKAAPVAKPAASETSPLFDSWLEKNRWYQTDEDMHDWADGAAMRMGVKAKQEGRQLSEQDVYDALTKRAKEKFPNKFPRVSAASPDGDGRKTVNGKSPKGGDRFEQLLAEMPEEMAAAAKSLVKSGLLTKEKYVEDFDAIGGR